MNIEALQELKDCQGMVYNKNYTLKQRQVMKELQKEGYVELAWVITPKGEKELEQK